MNAQMENESMKRSSKIIPVVLGLFLVAAMAVRVAAQQCKRLGFTGGTGAMANAAGQIQLRGEFDPVADTTSGDYIGTVCTP
jgi:hypothetical protein